MLFEPALVLLDQARRVKRNPKLTRYGLDEGDVVAGPAPELRRVRSESSDHRVEEDDRRRQNGPAPQLEQRRAPAEGIVGEPRVVLHIGDGGRLPFAQGEIRDREKRSLTCRDGLDSLSAPFGPERRRAVGLAEAYEAAFDSKGFRRLGKRGMEQAIDIRLRANVTRNLGDQTLALEPALERANRIHPLNGERSLGGKHLHQ